jgi:hypothetical protein
MGCLTPARHYPWLVMKPRLLLALALAFCVDAGAQERLAPANASPAPTQRAAPSLPFRYVGQLRQNGRLEVLLMRGGELHSVAAGESIDGEYRVDRITESTISFTYLPLKLKQTWAFRR